MSNVFKIVGNQKLAGEVNISGSKNASLPILAATLLKDGEYVLKNVPKLFDTVTMMNLLEEFGLEVTALDKGTYRIVNKGIKNHKASYDLVKTMRASFIVSGPLLANVGKATISLPGGCLLGPRPVDYHLQGFEALGAKIEINHGYVEITSNGLKAAEINLPFPSVGATQNIAMAAVFAEGKTVIRNAAREPEVVDLFNFLAKMGVKISGIGTEIIEIEGCSPDDLKAVEYEIIPDRLEAGVFIILSALFDGSIKLRGVMLEHLDGFKAALDNIGIVLESTNGLLEVKGKLKELKPAFIKVMPYPGYPTDLLPPMMVLLSKLGDAEKVSVIEETMFTNRYMHVPELNRMGANIRIDGLFSYTKGGTEFSAADVTASDIRGGTSLVIAGLVAEGETIVSRIYHIDRGYERLDDKLASIGANIRRAYVEHMN